MERPRCQEHAPQVNWNKPAAAAIEHIGGLTIAQGRRAGQPFRVLPWQARFLRGCLRPDVQSAALSVARGNGKSTLLAAVCAAYLDGPLAQPHSQVLLLSASREQASVILRHLASFLGERPHLRIFDHHGRQEAVNDRNGCRVVCKSSDPRRMHGLAPALIVCDELAQWGPRADDMVDACRTSLGKIPGSRMVCIGTRADSDDHAFSRLLKSADYAQVHAARDGDPPFQARTWRRANPSLDHMPDLLAAIRAEAAVCRMDETQLPGFRQLRLNAGTPGHVANMLLDADVWSGIEGEAEASGPHILGVDTGSTASMSAMAAFWPETGRLDAMACFPGIPSLRRRGIRDGIGHAYERMQADGDLMTAGGHVSDVSAMLAAGLARWGTPAAIVCDRWREGDLRDALAAARFPNTSLSVRGVGYKDGGQDILAFRRACLDGKVVPCRSLLLRMAMSEARTMSDPAGNHKLAKKGTHGKSRHGRDDAAAAAVLAVAAGVRMAAVPKPKPIYSGVIIG